MKYITLFFLSFILWLLLTFNLETGNLITGSVTALLTVLIFSNFFVDNVYKFYQPKRYFWLIIYIVIFTWECIKANFDVAYRVLHPALPVKPGIVKVPISVKSDMARTMLANSITMTPGTISVDLIGDALYVHWIYVSDPDPQIYSEKISGRFERYLSKIFD